MFFDLELRGSDKNWYNKNATEFLQAFAVGRSCVVFNLLDVRQKSNALLRRRRIASLLLARR